jgi:hypothetical protein
MDAMRDDWPAEQSEPRQHWSAARVGRAGALVAGGLVTGAVLAGAISASAATGTPTPSSGEATAQSGYQDSGSGRGTAGPGRGIGGSSPQRSDEKEVSGEVAAKLRAAALKAVPGGTVVRIETDAGDGAYEAHMTKSGGSVVTVKFDSNLAVIKVENGMGVGDPAPSGAAGGSQPSA